MRTVQASRASVPSAKEPAVPRPIFYIVGKVKRPGAYGMIREGRLTVQQAIAGAGGLDPRQHARVCEIVRKNPDQTEFTIKIDLASLSSATDSVVLIRPNDLIRVR